MKKQLLVIEPYVHCNVKTHTALLFNALDNNYIITNNKSLISSLKNRKNSICEVSITPDIKPVIHDIRLKFIGDLIKKNSKSFIYPFSLKESLNINDEHKIKNNEKIPNPKRYLKELYIYLNNKCSLSCSFCRNGYKQFTCCSRNNYSDSIEIAQIESVFSELSPKCRIFLLGGNIFEYEYLDKVVCKAKNTYGLFNITIVSHINNIKLKSFNTSFFSLDTVLKLLLIIDSKSINKFDEVYN